MSSISMFTVTGTVVNTFTQEGFVDKQTGEVTKPTFKVQLMGNVPVARSNQNRMELKDFSVSDLSVYEKLKGRLVRVPVGFMSAQRGNNHEVILFIPKSAAPEIVDPLY